MNRLLPITLALFLLAGGASSPRAQKATLVIHNRTDATLTVYAETLSGPYEKTAEIRVAPGETLRLPSFLPQGDVDVFTEARLVRPAVERLVEGLIISGASPSTRTLVFFPNTFGRSVLTDTATEEITRAPPDAGNGFTPNWCGKYTGEPIGSVEIEHYPGVCRDYGWTESQNYAGRQWPAAYWTLVGNVFYVWRTSSGVVGCSSTTGFIDC